jgi:hypothetical protein
VKQVVNKSVLLVNDLFKWTLLVFDCGSDGERSSHSHTFFPVDEQ